MKLALSCADCTSLPELSHLPLARTKGQLIELKWPKGLSPLPSAINSQLYCLMSPDNRHCIVGSTYEKNFTDTEPDVKAASEELFPKLYALLPDLERRKNLCLPLGSQSLDT